MLKCWNDVSSAHTIFPNFQYTLPTGRKGKLEYCLPAGSRELWKNGRRKWLKIVCQPEGRDFWENEKLEC